MDEYRKPRDDWKGYFFVLLFILAIFVFAYFQAQSAATEERQRFLRREDEYVEQIEELQSAIEDWQEKAQKHYELGLAEGREAGFESGFSEGYDDRVRIENADYYSKYSYATTLLEYATAYCSDPLKDLDLYDEVWGDLTAAEGDIVFETLTAEQRALVHFKEPKEYVFYIENRGERYHTLGFCYTLWETQHKTLRDIRVCPLSETTLPPCSICVDDTLYYKTAIGD